MCRIGWPRVEILFGVDSVEVPEKLCDREIGRCFTYGDFPMQYKKDKILGEGTMNRSGEILLNCFSVTCT